MRARFLNLLKSVVFPLMFVGALFLFFTPVAHAQATPPVDLGLTSQVQQSIGLASTDIRVVVARIIRTVLSLLGIIALVLVLYGGFIYMTSGGNEQKITDAKKIIINGVIGLAIILSSYAITSFIINKLVEATVGTTPGGGTTSSGGCGANCPYGFVQFYVKALPPSGQYCVRNAKPAVVFNQNVDKTTIPGNLVIKLKTTGVTVTGTWDYGPNNSTVLFTPTGSCSPSLGNDCLSSNTDYIFAFANPGNIKAAFDPTLALDCTLGATCSSVNFTSGDTVDRTPPVITMVAPPKNSAIEIGKTQPFSISYTDDNGVQNITLTAVSSLGGQPNVIGSVNSPTCQKTGTVTIPWNTTGFNPSDYNVTATGIDYSGQSGNDAGTYSLRPAHCFDGVKNADETGIDCGGTTCGACSGGTCTSNNQCSSGLCANGVCLTQMSIQSFTPPSGAPGTFVSIVGRYFGTSPGHVYFGKLSAPLSAADWVEAFSPSNCGTGFSYWNDNQIIVQVPTGTAFSAPIKVVTAPRDNGSGTLAEETDLSSSRGLANFQVTSIARPGICSLTPTSGSPGDPVSVSGNNFGLLSSSGDGVFFDIQKAAVLTGGGGIPAWTNNLITVATPGVLSGDLSVKVVKNNLESNKVKYTVNQVSGSTFPIITSIAPNTGPAGQYITIVGRNFGTNVGTVLFKTSPNDAVPLTGNFSFPSVCQVNLWSDTQVIVKAPSATMPGQTYAVEVKTADNKISLYDANQVFIGASGTPAPGICGLSLSGGPIPLPTGQKINIFGENFTVGVSDAYFWGANATDPGAISGRARATIDAANSSVSQLSVTPDPSTRTGPVSVYRTSDTKISNPVNFNVADCTVAGNSCQSGYQCCGAGGDKGLCIPNTSVCADATRFTGYVWRFSTMNIPKPPAVVERCDATTELGNALPSPSPSLMWGSGATEDNRNVCKSALVTVEFTAPLNQSTVNASSVKVNHCDSITTSSVCINPTSVTLTPGSYTLKTAFVSATEKHDYLQLKATTPWTNTGFYQVSLGTGIASFSADPVLPLKVSNSCGDGTAYCFAFAGGGQDCQLRAVVVTPYSFWTDLLESPMTGRVDSNTRAPLVYQGNGLSTQKCILLDTSAFNWSWSSRATAYADIFGNRTSQSAEASALANTVGIGLTGNSILIQAQATLITTSTSQNKVGTSPLTIDLSSPKVTDWWPKCAEACSNAEVGVQFNLGLSTRNLGNAVKLLKCLDENCQSTVDVTNLAALQLGVTPNLINIANVGNIGNLVTDTIYEVTVSNANANPLAALNNLWSRSSSTDPTSFGKPYDQQFVWRFRTKKDTCAVSKVVLKPASYTASNVTDRAVFSAQPFSAPDSCSTNGQKLNPWESNWNWSSSDVNVATVSTFSSRGNNPSCTANCTLRGSTIPSSVRPVPTGICGNGVVEAGEDCDSPNKSGGCSLNCLFINKTNLGSSQQFNSASSTASVCGNGSVGLNEDCDLGIPSDYSVSSSSLGCSSKCLHLGTKISSQWCFDHKVGFGGFSQTEYNAACLDSISRCGDGITSPDEDPGCDLGGGQHATFCNDRCLFNNVSHQKCAPNTEGCDKNGQYLGSSLTYATPTVCGDGTVGTGEEPSCESLPNLIITHNNLLNPWVLVVGVGLGSGSGVPPAQSSTIAAVTQNAAGTTFTGSGKFIIPCGYQRDSDCAAYGPNFGVGADTCCYAKPAITGTTPPDSGGNVCLNSALRIDFNGLIDQGSLSGSSIGATSSVLIARGEQGSACAAGEKNVTALALKDGIRLNEPWYEKILAPIKNFFVRLLGLPVNAAFNPTVWCAGSDPASASVEKISATASRINIALQRPLLANNPYVLILTPSVKNTQGVSIGLFNNRNFSLRFSTGSNICEINRVDVSPSTWYFSTANATARLTATSYSASGPIQPIPGTYEWFYQWGPVGDTSVTVPPNVAIQDLDITSLNRNGEVDVRALANVSVSNLPGTATGTVASGSSHVTVFLCENPWPPKSRGVTSIFPYSDSAGNHDGFNNSTNFFDGSTIPASDAGVGDGYFNFSTYYCADNGSTGVLDDWPYLRPAVQADSNSLKVAHGSCEMTGDVCDKDVDCVRTISLVDGSFENAPVTPSQSPKLVDATSTAWWQTTSAGHQIRVYNNSSAADGSKYIQLDKSSVYQDFVTIPGSTFHWRFFHRGLTSGLDKMQVSIGAPGVTLIKQTASGISSDNTGWGAVEGDYTVPFGQTVTRFSLDSVANANNSAFGNQVDNVSISLNPLACFVNSPVKRFLFTNDKNGDAIGIQIFRNAKHLSPLEWYSSGRSSGGQGFQGPVQSTIINGYAAASDGNNIYVGGLNYSNNKLYDVIYLFSVDTNATAETKHVFEELMKNLHFNTNLTYNDGYCGTSISSPLYVDKCVSDLDCPSGQVCSSQILKLQRNYQRINDLKSMDVSIQSYKFQRNTYPPLRAGSYLPGQTVSTWPSWSALGSALGSALPSDPVNKLGKGGTCTFAKGIFCTADANCPAGDHCTLHDPDTGWSIADSRFSFACATSSLAYRYSYSTSTGYTVSSRFEDPGITVGNLNNFVSGFGFSDPALYPGLRSWTAGSNPAGICGTNSEIASTNLGVCGDGIVNILGGEQCDPPGSQKPVDKSSCTPTGGNASVTTCDNFCHWAAPRTVSCASLSVCGNGVIETGEICDDGALNGTYNHCAANCQGLASFPPGYCGDNQVKTPEEVCDPGQIGVAKYGVTQAQSCSANCQLFGPYCGDGRVYSPNENCDAGNDTTQPDYNGKVCTPNGAPCTYCSATCQLTTVQPPTCSYVYSAWGTCAPDGLGGANQTRTVQSFSPAGCVGNPILSQSCTICNYTYNYGACTYSGTGTNWSQSMTVLTQSPAGCSGTPLTSQSCLAPACNYTYTVGACTYSGTGTTWTQTLTNPVPDKPGCTSVPLTSQSCAAPTCTYTYSAWSACQVGTGQTRTYTTSPAGCVGTPGPTNQTCCGDGVVNGGEVCDNGASNGVVCTPSYNASCTYCNSSCSSATVVPRTAWCGDGIVNGPEVCDGDLACDYTAGGITTIVKTFSTAGAGAWIVPTGVTSVKVEAWGGGGSGGVDAATGFGSGGGGGAYARANTLSVTPGTSMSYNVGSGGTKGVSGPGVAGGNTTFGTTVVVAAGGGGGQVGSAGQGGTIAGSIGDVKFAGGAGAVGGVNSLDGAGGGSAGSASNGNNALSGTNVETASVFDGGPGGAPQATPTVGPGGGGGGNHQGLAAGSGKDGQIKLTYQGYAQGKKYCNPTCTWKNNGTCDPVSGLSQTVTDDSNSNTGFKLAGYSLNNQTQVVGMGTAASVALASQPIPTLVQTDDSATTPSLTSPTGGFNNLNSFKNNTQVNGAGAGANVGLTSNPTLSAPDSWAKSNFIFASTVGDAVDSAGNIYVADASNQRIQIFSSSGVFLRGIGNGTSWTGAAPAPISGAGNGYFNYPNGVAVDPTGNIYVNDSGNQRIQVFKSSGVFILGIGNGTTWTGAAPAPISGAGNGYFNYSNGVAVDSSGNIYVADTSNYRIQIFSPSGVFLRGIGNGTTWTGAAPAPASGAGNGYFYYPYGVAVDSAGSIYVADAWNHRIQTFYATGVFHRGIGNGTTWTGGTPAPQPINGPQNGYLNTPYGVAVDSSGNIYVADSGNIRIQTYNSLGIWQRSLGNRGVSSGQFMYPYGVAVDSGGNIYVADTSNYRIQIFSSAGVFLRGIGNGTTWTGAAPAPMSGVTNGYFGSVRGVTVDMAGNIYVADTSNNRIQIFSSAGVFLRGIGNGTTWTGAAPATVSGSQNGYFLNPVDVAVDSAGNIYVSDYSNFRIQIFSSAGVFLRGIGNGTTWTGAAPAVASGAGNGYFNTVNGVAVDSSGNIYVADTSNNRIQIFSSAGVFLRGIGNGTTWTGAAPTPAGGSQNGYLYYPMGVAVDSAGLIYVADSSNNRIQIFSSAGVFLRGIGNGTIWTGAAPAPVSGIGDGFFNYPGSVDVDSAGNIYVSDIYNYRIQKLITSFFFNSSGTYTSYFDGGFSTANWGNFTITKGSSSGINQGSIRVQTMASSNGTSAPAFTGTGNCDTTTLIDGPAAALDISACAGTGRYLWYQATLSPDASQANSSLLNDVSVLPSNIVSSYISSGHYTSGPINIPLANSWGPISWSSTLTAGQNISMLVRSANNSAMTAASGWCSVTNGSIPPASCLRNGDTYVQFDATLNNGTDKTLTPSLNDLTVNFSGYSITSLPSNFALLEKSVFPTLQLVIYPNVMAGPFSAAPVEKTGSGFGTVF